MPKLTTKQIEEYGENRITDWCTNSNLTFNKSLYRDEQGWDLFIESNDSYYNDDDEIIYTHSPFKCKVQVKCTTLISSSFKQKLSNFKKLIDSPFPSFVALITIDNTGKVLKAKLVEIDKYIGQKFLTAVKSSQKQLHKEEMVIYQKNAKKLDIDNRHSLDIELRNIIGDLDQYIESKKQWKKDIGYFTYDIELNLNPEDLESEDFLKLLSDFDLGKVDKLNVKKIDKNITWQGLKHEGPPELQNVAYVKLLLNEPLEDFKVNFTTIDERETVEIDLKMWPSTFVRGALSDRYQKFRFFDDFFSIIIDKQNKLTIETRLPSVEEYLSIQKARSLILFFDFISKLVEEEKFLLEIIKKSDSTNAKFKYTFRRKEFESLSNSLSPIIDFYKILTKLELSLDLNVLVKRLSDSAQNLNIAKRILYDGEALHFRYEIDSDFELDEKCCSLLLFIFDIGKEILWMILSINGSPERINIDDYNLVIKNPKIYIEDKGFESKRPELPDYLNSKYEKLAEKYEDNHLVLKSERLVSDS